MSESPLRHAGLHWNNGPSKDARLYVLPSPTILMLSTEARFRSADAFARDKQLVWRAIPRVGKRPAELKYNASKIADECLNLWDAQPHPAGERLIFQALNEPTINTERGDNEDDFSDLDARFVRLARLESELEPELRRRLPVGTLLASTPHVPDGRAYDRLPLWWDAANHYDVIMHHEYGTPEEIAERVQWHLDTWPERSTFLGEWHNDDPERTLQLLAEIAAREPRFLGATWFIGKWFDAPDWWTSWKNLQDNEQLYNIFLNPPLAAQGPVDPPVEPEPEPEMPPPTLPIGLDVASYQGYPDWAAVAQSGISFAITKATESTTYTNPTFAHNWREIKANGMYRGAYHFARPDANPPETEADYFLRAVEALGLEDGDLLALDLEDGTGDLSDWTLRWLRHVEGRVGFKPLLYTARGYIDGNQLGNRPELSEFGLWLASWQANMPAAPSPWDVIAFWQYADTGTVPGIVGPVDHNVFNGPVDRIPLYGKPATDPVPEPEPIPEPVYAVGPGILAAMAINADLPASDEVYVRHGDRDAWSEAFGISGSRYCWVPSTGRVHRYDPAA